jgi:hypothetical protein
LGERDELQIEIRFQHLLDVDERFDREQAVVANVDMASDPRAACASARSQ